MNGTRELRSRIREIIPYTNREPGCPLTRVHEKIDLPSHEKHQSDRLSGFQVESNLICNCQVIKKIG